jgi:hypothetical protein
MRAPLPGSEGGTASLANPAIVVILVLMVGATMYLWRARYMRTRTAYITIGILVAALALFGTLMYNSAA